MRCSTASPVARYIDAPLLRQTRDDAGVGAGGNTEERADEGGRRQFALLASHRRQRKNFAKRGHTQDNNTS